MKTKLIYLLSIPVFFLYSCAGDSASPDSGAGKAGSMARFAISGNYLYTVDNSSMKLFNISDIAKPIQEKTIGIGFNIETIFPYKDKLFIGSQDGMYIYEISDPSNPQQSSVFTHARSCDPVVADSQYAFITLRKEAICSRGVNQLDVVDIKNINTPIWITSYPLENPYGLGLDGKTLFVCDGYRGLKVYNVAKPDSAYLVSTVTGIETYDVIPNNGILLLVGKDGFYQYDYSNTDSLKKLSYLPVEY